MQCYLFLLDVHLIVLDAVQLDGEAARVADGEFLLDGEVRHNPGELDDGLTELQASFDALTSTQKTRPTTALRHPQHQPALVLPL